jgi:BirA family biotin operon repressor/biotin-[acetyl-CoA-carboxylase] ligase
MKTELVVDKLSIKRIRRDLATEILGRHMYLFDAIPSTNAALRQLALSGAEEGTVVLAETQSAGRGRMGSTWFSPPELNLYVSVLLRPAVTLAEVPVCSLIASLALTDAVWATGLPAAIKWPNDILVEGRKVAGCLVDVAGAGGRVDHVILGAGINLNVPTDALCATLGDAGKAAGSMSELAGHPVDRNVFTATFLNALERWLTVYRTDGPRAVVAAWRARDALSGQEVDVRGEGAPYHGRAVGIGDDGYLLVEDAAGGRYRVLTGEIRASGAADSA